MISIILPAYNEENNLDPILDRIHKVLAKVHYRYEIIVVDDGSTDKTLDKILQISKNDRRIKYISLSKNFGHQNALKAGLDNAIGEAVISMDADLQHPPELMIEFLKKWEEGYDVVFSIRNDTLNSSFLKRKTAKTFYGLLNSLSDIKIVPGAADFRLLDRKVVNVILNLNENELFIRGLVSWIGFKQIGIEYYPDKRYSGESKYTLIKMFNFGLQGITSFSIRPLYIATYLGIGFSILSIVVYIPYILLSFYSGHVVSGWSSVLATVVFLGGLQLMILGILGIYVGKLFMQVKKRPSYIIQLSNIEAPLKDNLQP